MPTSDEIGDDELLFRKISVKSEWYDPLRWEIKPEAFKPWPRDTNGISFDRAQSEQHPDFRSIEDAAVGLSPKGYYVAVFRARSLTENGFELAAEPDNANNNPGHSVITNLRYSKPMDPECETMMIRLTYPELRLSVEGPFPPRSL